MFFYIFVIVSYGKVLIITKKQPFSFLFTSRKIKQGCLECTKIRIIILIITYYLALISKNDYHN